MLATLLTAVSMLQDPLAVASSASSPQAVVEVRGAIELDAAAAFASAREAVVDHAQRLWQERAARLAAQQLPGYMPDLFVQQALQRFLQQAGVERTVQLVGRDDREREHEFGSSWQTTLWVAEDPRAVAACERLLRANLRRAEREVLWKSGGTVVFWAVLGIALGWLDRLSRGYMTGRLRLLGLVLGAAVPAVAFLL